MKFCAEEAILATRGILDSIHNTDCRRAISQRLHEKHHYTGDIAVLDARVVCPIMIHPPIPCFKQVDLE
jgi:hypothetical protein